MIREYELHAWYPCGISDYDHTCMHHVCHLPGYCVSNAIESLLARNGQVQMVLWQEMSAAWCNKRISFLKKKWDETCDNNMNL